MGIFILDLEEPENAEAETGLSDNSGLLCVGEVAPIASLVLHDGCDEIFRVTEDGEIEVDGAVTTDDDAAVADCMRKWAKVVHGVMIRDAKRKDA